MRTVLTHEFAPLISPCFKGQTRTVANVPCACEKETGFGLSSRGTPGRLFSSIARVRARDNRDNSPSPRTRQRVMTKTPRLTTLRPRVEMATQRFEPRPKQIDQYYLTSRHREWRLAVCRRAGWRCEAIEYGRRPIRHARCRSTTYQKPTAPMGGWGV